MSLYRCTHCNSVYDPGGVEIVARYADCDMFKAPCCGRTVDNREWKSMPDIERVRPGEIRSEIHGNGWRRRDFDGRFMKVIRS